MQLEGWNVIDEKAGVLWREYVFSKGAYATTLVFRGADGLVVVSPGTGLDARAYDALREVGEVRALIANNPFHHMGQPVWRARFPDAVSYCPPGAVKALDKRASGVSFRPLDALALPEHVRWEDLPGFKTGEAILSVGTGKGSVWYSGDLLTNIQRTPGPPFSWLFSWTDSAPGFRLFKPAVWLSVKDKKALREWTLRRLAEDPPAVVVPAHGPPVDTGDVAALAKAQIERL
jgi:glyoxylase-like metal-dependent hydrolase (beta-lactamase superfamily II)